LLLGANRIDIPDSGSQLILSATSIVHSQYDLNTINNDIAVIQLPSAITFNSEYCHLLMNIKIIFLVHEPLCCYLHCLKHRN
jgi:hypothetical protein